MNLLTSALALTCFILISVAVANGQEVHAKLVPFDRYGAIHADDASARLDNFAVQLQNQPEAIGVLVSYGPTGKMFGTANHVLRVSRNYLVNGRGIKPDRIRLINAGRFEKSAEMFNELWVVPPGAPSPEPENYDPTAKETSGKFAETVGWAAGESFCCGPVFGDPIPAAFSDLLRQQPKSVGYIVAFNMGNHPAGTWRRVAKRYASQMRADGVEASRIKISYGGKLKLKKGDYGEVRLHYWILPSDAPPPRASLFD